MRPFDNAAVLRRRRNVLIPLSEALSRLDDAVRTGDKERVSIHDAFDRLLTEQIRSPMDLPPFSRSAMDGFAVSKQDLDARGPAAAFEVTEVIAAGDTARSPVRPGTAVQIMTGAALPEGADWVVRVEYSESADGRVRFTGTEKSSNIVWAGENGKAGDLVVSPRRLGVHDIGAIASLGINSLEVLAAPRLGVLSTGDEVREPGETLGPGRIYNSNAVQLLAHGRQSGFVPRYYGIARDTEEDLTRLLSSALADSDAVVLSGGVSKGEFDYVPRVLGKLGVDTVFHRVAMKPGRPTFFGVRDRSDGKRQYVFGLPGNPVSTFVTFELFVVRLLYRLAGLPAPVPTRSAVLGETLRKSDPDRTEFVPVVIEDDVARPVRYGGSSHLNALSQANGLLQLESGITELPGGTRVAIRPI
ncbi:MAG: gephyrin-like molybdotransferase Glp [Spirochaetaceae bacterium]